MNYLLHFELWANHQEAISDNFVKLKGLIDFPMYCMQSKLDFAIRGLAANLDLEASRFVTDLYQCV